MNGAPSRAGERLSAANAQGLYGPPANFNLTSKTDRNGNTISYDYDYQNHLEYKFDPGQINYSYDPAGRLTEVDDFNNDIGHYYFSYDNMNRLTSTTTNYAYTSLGPQTVAYGYDASSNRISMTDPVGSQTAYAYDQLNRLSTLSNPWAGSFSLGYDQLSERIQLTRPNGVDTLYTYDPLSHLLSVQHQLGTTPLLLGMIDGAAYSYDSAGNRVSKADLQANVNSFYTYDNIYQLLQVQQQGIPNPITPHLPSPCYIGGCPTTETYSYDLVGNRLSSLTQSPYTYNTSNELLSTPSGSYTYDKDGEMLSRPDGTQFSWDYEGRLSQAVLPNRGGTVTFHYDPFGKRIQKSGPLGTTNYFYDGANILETADQNGNVLARYAGTQAIDEPLAELVSGTVAYYEQDGVGTVTSLTDVNSNPLNTYTYDSYGNLTASTNGITNPFQYSGREFDQELGIYYYRARYYDENTGRFTSEDPLGERDNLNMYAYVHNNPLNFDDPLGQYQTKGFDPDQKALLDQAIAEALAKLRQNCPSCAGADGPAIADAMQQATFVLRPRLKDCGETGPLTFLGLRHVIALGPSAFHGECCSLASVVTHEVVHSLTHGENMAYGIEKSCFGCSDTRKP